MYIRRTFGSEPLYLLLIMPPGLFYYHRRKHSGAPVSLVNYSRTQKPCEERRRNMRQNTTGNAITGGAIRYFRWYW